MTQNHFYEKKGPFPLNEIVKAIDCDIVSINKNNIEIYGFESLSNASSKDITFLNSSKYKNYSINTKASACITTRNLSKFLLNQLRKIGKGYNSFSKDTKTALSFVIVFSSKYVIYSPSE